ncbi:hypothetical protein [Paenibacillus donghaensis]|uniref:Uncharacterized protein n=1 Tax=Paenibacillus donghaensis TaxID=414771 RepID=A0A2Z2KW35_9BACL|nr:hypothetical protein [Paenibacillus donghaensis]ASA25601.1 hypothetical protein B9T62_35640 [Paenibacillus donghaensis]
MTVSAMVNGKFTPEFAAYTKLALSNRFQNEARGIRNDTSSSSMGFSKFIEAIQKDQEVNHSYARKISGDEVTNNRLYQQSHGVNEFSNRRFTAIERAYELGLVNQSGVLLSSFNAEG